MTLGADAGPTGSDSQRTRGQTSCHKCGAGLAIEGRFCSSCGAERTGAGNARLDVTLDRPEERRTVTVLFADLAGFTSVAERMDPEAVKVMVGGVLERLAAVVTDHGGHIDKFIGDNVMALFGAPSAHEDDAERAVRAGLAMQSVMKEVQAEVAAPVGGDLQLCVGINTGEVLAGWIGGTYTVMGDAVNVAARLQAAAEPGSVVVGGKTAAETGRAIRYRELGPFTLKGKAETVTAWEAIAVDERARERPVAEAPLVGRRRELGDLERVLGDAITTRTAAVALLVGEPGVGKSRVVREFVDRVGHAVTVRSGASLAYGATTPYRAIGEVLRQECDVVDSDDITAAAQKLERRMEALVSDEALRRRTLVALLPLLGAAPHAPSTDDADDARHATFSAIRVVLSAVARERPLVVVLEDLHWADRGVLDLVDFVAGSMDVPAMFICTARPELRRTDRLAESSASRLVLALGPLGRDEITELVLTTAGPGAANHHVRTIVDRSGGNPLFAEELIRHLNEFHDGGPPPVPTTLQALLAARLDLLAPAERRLVQRASVFGPSFSRSVLEMSVRDSTEVSATVRSLIAKGYLVAAADELTFHHELIRDAAYGMLPKAERARQHLAAADILERQAADSGDQSLGVLAEHYLRAAVLADEANLSADIRARARDGALRLLVAAGDRSGGLSAYEEAMAQYEAAASLASEGDLLVDLFERIGDTARRLGDPGKAIEAWERAQSLLPADAVERLAELDRKLGRSLVDCGAREQAIERYETGIQRLLDRPACSELIRLYEDAAALYVEAGENMLAIYTGEKALRVAHELHATAAASRAHVVFGTVLGRTGDRTGARRNFDTAVELAREVGDGATAAALRAYGHHLHAHESDRPGATQRLLAALRLAEDLGDVPLQVGLAGELGELALQAVEWDEVDRLAHECERLRVESGRIGRRSTALRLRAWRCWSQGDVDRALELLEQSHANARATGDRQPAVAALHAMAAVEDCRDERDRARQHVLEARELCEGAGLLSSLVAVVALGAVVAMSSGLERDARAELDELESLVERIQSPAAVAATTECAGVVRADVALLEAADARWLGTGRPMDAARCAFHRGSVLLTIDPAAGRAALGRAARRFDRLGVVPWAERARRLA